MYMVVAFNMMRLEICMVYRLVSSMVLLHV